MTETPRIPVPAGEGRTWARAGLRQPKLTEATWDWHIALIKMHAVPPIAEEYSRLRVAKYHDCQR